MLFWLTLSGDKRRNYCLLGETFGFSARIKINTNAVFLCFFMTEWAIIYVNVIRLHIIQQMQKVT